ncbi:MAG: SDR family oxidoreductase [Chloroflexota bacterium]
MADKQSFRFSGKVALVSGSGRGIGRAIALHFARNGAAVIVNFFRNRKPAQETLTEIEALTRYLAVELAPSGIVVNAVSPGMVETDALSHFASMQQRGIIEKTVASTPTGRLVAPEDVAHLVAFLCAPDAAMIRGQVIVIDGGFTLPAG